MTGNAATHILDAPDSVPDNRNKPAPVRTNGTSSTAGHAAADAVGIIREWGKVYELAATDCCCCGSPLRDSVSVTKGIGPVCSKQHYDIDFPITQGMVEDALGTLYTSGLDRPVKLAAKALKTKPRDLCNVLVWWASAHLDHTDVVLDCAAIVTAFGFVSLGDRLRERNTNVVITRDGDDHFIVRARSKRNVRQNMRLVKEASPVAREGRFKYGWRVENTRKALVWTILGEDFGDQWATVPGDGKASKVIKIDATSYWNVRKAFEAAYPPPKPAATAPKPLVVRPGKEGWLEVHTPRRNFGFVAEFKAAVPYRDRTWDREKVCWTVRTRYEAKTRELVAAHFNGAV